MNPAMPSALATSPKGSNGSGEGAGSCGEVSCFKVVRDQYGRGSREVGAEVSELISGISWGGGLGAAVVEACTREGGREEGT